MSYEQDFWIKDNSLPTNFNEVLHNPEKSKEILEELFNSSEELITVENLFPVFFDLSTLRDAFSGSIARILIDEGKEDDIRQILMAYTQKNTSNGELRLGVHADMDNPNIYSPLDFTVNLIENNSDVLNFATQGSFQMALKDDSFIINHFTYFNTPERSVNGMEILKLRNIDDYKFLWKGMRWAAKNILEWNTRGFSITPREL